MIDNSKNIFSKVIINLIIFYRNFISPIFPSCCRFVPSCSEYGLEAFSKYKFTYAFKLTILRIFKCRPGGPYGFDPLPDIQKKKEDINVGCI